MPGIIKRIDEKYCVEVEDMQNMLLNTIRIPKNIHYLTDSLPKPNY